MGGFEPKEESVDGVRGGTMVRLRETGAEGSIVWEVWIKLELELEVVRVAETSLRRQLGDVNKDRWRVRKVRKGEIYLSEQ